MRPVKRAVSHVAVAVTLAAIVVIAGAAYYFVGLAPSPQTSSGIQTSPESTTSSSYTHPTTSQSSSLSEQKAADMHVAGSYSVQFNSTLYLYAINVTLTSLVFGSSNILRANYSVTTSGGVFFPTLNYGPNLVSFANGSTPTGSVYVENVSAGDKFWAVLSFASYQRVVPEQLQFSCIAEINSGYPSYCWTLTDYEDYLSNPQNYYPTTFSNLTSSASMPAPMMASVVTDPCFGRGFACVGLGNFTNCDPAAFDGCTIAYASVAIENETLNRGIYDAFNSYGNTQAPAIFFPGQIVTFVISVENPTGAYGTPTGCAFPPCEVRYVVYVDNASILFGTIVSEPSGFPLPPHGIPSGGLWGAWFGCLYYSFQTPSTAVGTWSKPYNLTFSAGVTAVTNPTNSNVTTESGTGYLTTNSPYGCPGF
jgi:hypothetical protein